MIYRIRGRLWFTGTDRQKESRLLCGQGPAGPFYRGKFLGWGSWDSAFFTVDSLCAPVSLSQVHTQVNQGSRRCQDLTVGSIVWKASPDATPRLTAPLIPSSCTLSSYPFFYFHRQNKPSETDCRINPFLFLQDNWIFYVEKGPCSTCNKLRIFEKKTYSNVITIFEYWNLSQCLLVFATNFLL